MPNNKFRLHIPQRFMHVRMVDPADPSNFWTSLYINDELLAWLKENTPTFIIHHLFQEKVVEFDNHSDFILFKLAFDIAGGPVTIKIDLERYHGNE